MNVLWYEDFNVKCLECGVEHRLGTAQMVIKRFFEPVDVELPCKHSVTATMTTKKKGSKVSSYSQLDLYLQCPYRWQLKYQDRLDIKIISKYLEYGLTVHETLEAFFEAKKDGELLEHGTMEGLYDMFFNAHNPPFDSIDEMLSYYAEGVVMVNRLYNPVNEVEQLMVDAEIVGVEHPFEVVIDDVVIIGYIDLILRTDKGLILIDHKSSGKVFDKSKLKNNLQFPIYTMAVLEDFGEMPYKSMYNFTRIHKCQEVSHTVEELEVFEHEISKILKKMKKLKHTPKPTNLCYWCDYSKYKANECKYSSDFKPKQK